MHSILWFGCGKMKLKLNVHLHLVGIIVICLVQPLFAETERSNDYTSFIRHSLCRASDPIRYPTNSQDVVDIINEAIDRGIGVKAFGTRHSITDIICTDGIPIDMRSFKSIKMNDDGTATFGAGVTLQEAGDFLLQYKRALRVQPAYGNLTLVGVIGTGAHGSSIKYHSSISAQVATMTIVNGLGNVMVISSDEDLKSFKIHLGLLGVILNVTLHTVPLYKVKSELYVVSDTVLANGEAINWAKTSDQITFYWFPSINEIVVSNFTFVPAETDGNTKIFMSSTFESNVLNTVYKESAFNLSSSDCTAASALGKKMLHFLEMRFRMALVPQVSNNETHYSVGYPHDMFSAICGNEDNEVSACSWSHPKPYSIETMENELDFDLNDLPAVYRTIKDIVNKTSVAFSMYGIILRFSGKSDIHMSTSYKRDVCHLEFEIWKRSDPYNNASGNLAGYQTILQALTKQFNARSHWGKSGLIYHSSDIIDLRLDSHARGQFIDAMNRFDPHGTFLNNFGRRLTHKGTKIDIDPLTTRCALLDNCFCSEDLDCGDNQICTTIPGYDYPVCETKNVVAMEFKRNDFPSTFEVGHWFFNSFPKLVSSSSC